MLLNLHDVAFSEEGGKPVAKDNWSFEGRRLLYGHMTTLFRSSACTLTLRVFHRNKFAEKAVYSSPDFLNRYRKSEVLDSSKQIYIEA